MAYSNQRSASEIETYSSDSSFTMERGLPSRTSNWDIFTLESVGVYYNPKPFPVSTVLDIIHEQTGMFGPLSSEQKQTVKDLQDRLSFSYSIFDVLMEDFDYYLEETKKGLIRDKEKQIAIPSFVQEFTYHTVMMIQCAKERKKVGEKVSGVLFVDLFKIFVMMCGLFPSQGEEHKSIVKVQHHTITSISDVVVYAGDLCSSSPTTVGVVSIFEVKHLNGQVLMVEDDVNKTKPLRKTSSVTDVSKSGLRDTTDNEKLLHEEPAIYKSIAKKVLGQHGGELLLHEDVYGMKFKSKNKNCRLHPGMIVIGTQVTFTLLEYNTDHKKDLHYKNVTERRRSCIYYSEPRDLLMKEDRDLLFESFVRLSNVKL